VNRRKLQRDVLLAIVLFALHALLRRELAGDAIVSALFAPKGPHAAWTLLLGLSFVVLRVVLFVGVPGWIVAQLFLAAGLKLKDLGTNR